MVNAIALGPVCMHACMHEYEHVLTDDYSWGESVFDL